MTKTSTMMILALALAACGSDEGNDDVAGSTAALSTEVTAEAAIVAATAPPEGLDDPEAAATAAAEALTAIFEGCSTSEVVGASVTWTLTDCAGEYALVELSGQIEATYRPIAGAVEATVSIDVEVAGGGSVELDAEVTYETSAEETVLSVSSVSAGTGPRGGDTARSGTYTLASDGSCISLNGMWEGDGATSWTLIASGYRVCSGECPTGTITRSGRTEGTVTFDGSAMATVTVGDQTETLPLLCDG